MGTKGSRAASKSNERADVFSGVIGSMSGSGDAQAGKIPRFCSTVKVYEKFCEITGVPIHQHKMIQFKRSEHRRNRTSTIFSAGNFDYLQTNEYVAPLDREDPKAGTRPKSPAATLS